MATMPKRAQGITEGAYRSKRRCLKTEGHLKTTRPRSRCSKFSVRRPCGQKQKEVYNDQNSLISSNHSFCFSLSCSLTKHNYIPHGAVSKYHAHSDHTYHSPLCNVSVRHKSKHFMCMIDTGSEISCISRTFAQETEMDSNNYLVQFIFVALPNIKWCAASIVKRLSFLIITFRSKCTFLCFNTYQLIVIYWE